MYYRICGIKALETTPMRMTVIPKVIIAEAIMKIFPTGQANNPWLGILGFDLISPTIAKDIGLFKDYEGIVNHFFLDFTLLGDFL